MRIVLAPMKFEFERKAYSLIMLMSDTGGFNEAILTLPAFILSYYASAMY